MVQSHTIPMVYDVYECRCIGIDIYIHVYIHALHSKPNLNFKT